MGTKKHKLLAICFMAISIILTVVIIVQTWITTPIRFEGTTDDVYIMPTEEFVCIARDKQPNDYGETYCWDSDLMPVSEKLRIYRFLKTFKAVEDIPPEDKISNDEHFFTLSTWGLDAHTNKRTGVYIESRGDRYIEVVRSWKKYQMSPMEKGESWFFEVDKQALDSFITDFIKRHEKAFPKELQEK